MTSSAQSGTYCESGRYRFAVAGNWSAAVNALRPSMVLPHFLLGLHGPEAHFVDYFGPTHLTCLQLCGDLLQGALA